MLKVIKNFLYELTSFIIMIKIKSYQCIVFQQQKMKKKLKSQNFQWSAQFKFFVEEEFVEYLDKKKVVT